MMSPQKIGLFLFSVAAALLLISWVMPKNGVEVFPGFRIHFLSLDEVFSTAGQELADITPMLDMVATMDGQADTAATEESLIVPGEILQPIEMNAAAMDALRNSFLRLDTTQPLRMHILHYGDSQIESDRLTSYMRDKWQRQYGGYGPGWIPVMSYSKPGGVTVTTTGPWIQQTLFGSDERQEGVRFGHLLSTSVIGSGATDSTRADTLLTATASITANTCLYARAKQFNRVVVFTDAPSGGGQLTMEVGTAVFTWDLDSGVQWETISLPELVSDVQLTFRAVPGTMVHGISLESEQGVWVDNIPLRGSSGTIFRQSSQSLLALSDARMQVGMVWMQFGGNVMPYMKDEQQSTDYGKWFGSQIRYMQSVYDRAAFLVIGPSDMATKIGATFESYPLLSHVRDALRSAAISQGAAYYDLLEAMGGLQSIPAWVASDPPLAMPDYTHFTPAGARLMAEMLYESLVQARTKVMSNED